MIDDVFNASILKERLSFYEGDYESHITVSCDEKQFPLFEEQCALFNAKALIIELHMGATPRQPMLCKRHSNKSSKNPSDSLNDIAMMVESLSKKFAIERVKVEASLRNKGIPHTLEAASKLAADCYFEHHLKIDLPNNFDEQALRLIAQQFDGHLSKNPLSKSSDRQKRFITQRFYQCTAEKAFEKLIALQTYLVQSNYQVSQVIQEFNIYDSNIGLDAGWMTNESR